MFLDLWTTFIIWKTAVFIVTLVCDSKLFRARRAVEFHPDAKVVPNKGIKGIKKE